MIWMISLFLSGWVFRAYLLLINLDPIKRGCIVQGQNCATFACMYVYTFLPRGRAGLGRQPPTDPPFDTLDTQSHEAHSCDS